MPMTASPPLAVKSPLTVSGPVSVPPLNGRKFPVAVEVSHCRPEPVLVSTWPAMPVLPLMVSGPLRVSPPEIATPLTKYV